MGQNRYATGAHVDYYMPCCMREVYPIVGQRRCKLYCRKHLIVQSLVGGPAMLSIIGTNQLLKEYCVLSGTLHW